MNNKLNRELVSRSLQLAALSEMDPDDRIARITWDRIQDDLEREDSMIYGMKYCIANIATLVSDYFKENEKTLLTLKLCDQLIKNLGWSKDEVIATGQAKEVFIDYIKEVVSMYNDTKQSHCENAQCILAMNMNSMLLQDIEYAMNQSQLRQRNLVPALETASELRAQMIEVFGWDNRVS
ncbi:MAG: hypothetical protein CMN98_11230 [Synechococcus sp. NP17]|nr:hypothetical protein [Synechococcus sp. NP17]